MTLGTDLTNRKYKYFAFSRLIESLARQIPSPVLRLRFLRAAALLYQGQDPPRSAYQVYKPWLLRLFLVLSLVFTTPSSVVRVEPPRAQPANNIPQPANNIPPTPEVARPLSPAVRVERPREIWQVEKTDAFETYSNGLRIDNQLAIPATRPRSYLAFPATRPEDVQGQRRSVPAGIVFHTTESRQAPFESGQNSTLKRIGKSLLAYVRLKRSYHFVIDRFGRVYRVVPESDAANHAGSSIWADPEWLYLNLNESFLGVSFETQTSAGEGNAADDPEAAVNPAQIRSAALLTDLLRQRYGIRAGNCVTHAQVSVNASSLRIGYHLDWASSFPFDQLGLPDNYALALPSVYLFGFEYDADFERHAGARVYREAELSEQVLRGGADAAHVQPSLYRKTLQQRYRSRLAAVRRDEARGDEARGDAVRTDPEE
jgi:hypothetical protein